MRQAAPVSTLQSEPAAGFLHPVCCAIFPKFYPPRLAPTARVPFLDHTTICRPTVNVFLIYETTRGDLPKNQAHGFRAWPPPYWRFPAQNLGAHARHFARLLFFSRTTTSCVGPETAAKMLWFFAFPVRLNRLHRRQAKKLLETVNFGVDESRPNAPNCAS